MIPVSWYLTLSAILFCIGMYGFLTRRNVIIMFLCIELMLNAANLNFVAFSHYLTDLRGQVFTFFIIGQPSAWELSWLCTVTGKPSIQTK